MKTIILISCCKTKLPYKAAAEFLYQSAGFKKQLQYAKSLNPDDIFILSALHHLVPLSKEIAPYNVCLKEKNATERKEWAKIVLNELSNVADLKNDKFIILAGKDYYQDIIKELHNFELPLKNLLLGERLQWLDENTKTQSNESLCFEIHKWANQLQRFTYPFDFSEIPENGIYLFFEKGEKFKDIDRIVRIGTHTGDNNLCKRIKEHLTKENKDRSIFRKNIGRAILNKNNDSFLEIWNLDFTIPKNHKIIESNPDYKMKLLSLEKEISDYMCKNFSFACIPIETKEERLKYEAFLIKSLSSDNDFKPSESWLGNYSPIEKIKNSGLWLVNELAINKKHSSKANITIHENFEKSNMESEQYVSKTKNYINLYNFLRNNTSDSMVLELKEKDNITIHGNFEKSNMESKQDVSKTTKYINLYNFLRNNTSDFIVLELKEIEKIIFPEKLPNSAYTYSAWWSNTGHNHAHIWTAAGYRTTNFTKTSITFVKDK